MLEKENNLPVNVHSRTGKNNPRIPLRFEIYADRSEYVAGEAILLRALLLNLSSDDLVVNGRLLVNRPEDIHEVSLTVTEPNGKKLPLIARINAGKPQSTDLRTLAPFECVGRLLHLQLYYRLSQRGEYTVHAEYSNSWKGVKGKSTPWIGTLESNDVKFAVVKKR